MEQVKFYQITPEKFLEAKDILIELRKIRKAKKQKVLFGRWDYTRYKRIYVDINEKNNELGYIDLIRVKFVVTAKPDLDFFTPDLIDEISFRINEILDRHRDKNNYNMKYKSNL